MTGASPEGKRYKVLVEDNFHHMYEGEQYEQGEYESCERAIEECKRIVDDFLASEHEPGMTAEYLWGLYTTFGDSAVIVPGGRECPFSSWEYARQRCEEICAGEGAQEPD